MRKLLATTAIATMAMTGAASAQSVLERVLDQTTAINDDVTGIFANTADNIGTSGTPGTSSTVEEAVTVQVGDVLTVDDGNGTSVTGTVNADGKLVDADGSVIQDNDGNDIAVTLGAQLLRTTDGTNTVADAALSGAAKGLSSANAVFTEVTTDTPQFGIDGSITNAANRIDQATANVDNQVEATQAVTANFGSMATTVLGAVNTGEIGLGTNQEVDEAVADASQAVRSTISQVGTDTGETVLAVNSAMNEMGINGSISNTFDGVNATVAAVSPDQLDILSDGGSLEVSGVGDLLGRMETTVLGAVNTGTIVSGVNNQVEGTVAGIVGNSATNMFSENAPAADDGS